MVDSAEKVKGRNEMALARNKKYTKEVENVIMRSEGG